MQSDIYAMKMTFFLNCLRISITIVCLTCLIDYSWELILVAFDGKKQKHSFGLNHDHYAVLLPGRQSLNSQKMI